MKRFSYFLSALALIVLMQGCGSSPSVEPEIPDWPNNPTQSAVQLRLKGNIASLTPSTRVNEGGFEADDKVGVYVSATGALASSGNMLDNTAFTYSSGNITAPEGKEVYWGTPETKLSVWAYYPYATNVENLAEYPFAVAADQSTAEMFYNSDFITAKATNLAPQTEAVNLTFNHSLSKINITLEAGDGITADELAAAEKSFSIGELVTAGTIDLATGTATAGEATATITPLASGGVNYSAIVYPQQGEVAFRMVMDGDTYLYSTDVDFAAGMQYDYTLTINVREPQQMSLKTTTITPWGDGADHAGVMSDIIAFNDDVFKNYLLNANLFVYQQNETANIYDDYVDSGNKIDANNDGEISITEAEAVVFLDMDELGVTDFSGIEYFINLEYLSCEQESVWDYEGGTPVLSKCLSSLDVSSNTALKFLNCRYNKLTSLDVSNNTALTYLHCGANKLTSLDVSKNTALEYLDCDGNQLSTLDVSNNIALTSLRCSENQLTSLDVSRNTALKSLRIEYAPNLESIDITKNIALISLSISGPKLASIDVTKNVDLTNLTINSPKLASIDVSNNTELVQLAIGGIAYAYGVDRAPLASVDISSNLKLKILAISSSNIASIDLSEHTQLEWVYVIDNLLTELDVSNNPNIAILRCNDNKLTTLDVSKNIALTELSCNPMNDENGNNLLAKLYLASGQSIEFLDKPDATTIEYK